MNILIRRTLPPAAAPIPLSNIIRALPSCLRNESNGFGFEQEIKQEFGLKYCLLVSSGKAALVLILRALRKLYPGREEVLIPAFTCYSVPAAVKKSGLKIRLCDMGPGSLDYNKDQLRTIIQTDRKENKLLCVLVTHLFGCPADFAGIKEIVGEKIPLVEDSAQAMGEEIDNRKVGTLGDIGFFSLGRGKALSTTEGGVIVTSREDLSNELALLSNKLDRLAVSDKIKMAAKTIFITLFQQPFLFGLPKALPFLRLGETVYEEEFPVCLMSSFQSMLAHNWQERLAWHQRNRRKNIHWWQENLPRKLSPVCPRKKGISLIRFPLLVSSGKERDMFCQKGEETGCGIMPSYPTSINEIPQIIGEFAGQHYPNAKRLAECLLTLPVHEYVRESDRIRIKNLFKV